MSLQEIAAAPPREDNAPGPQADLKVPVRSWRKKFRKMKMVFDRAMEESNSLYREEQKALAIAKRLQEQNDQLLDLLLDVNSDPQIAPAMRYNLRSPSPTSSAVPSLEPDSSSISLDKLEKTLPHSIPSPETLQLHPELSSENPLGYFDPNREEEYLLALDGTLADPQGYPPDDTSGRPIKAIERLIVTEKELSLRNPQSVTNWLRRNQPEVFLQEKYEERTNAKASRQAAADSGGAAPSGRGGKRASIVNLQTPTTMKAEAENMDDDMSILEPQPFGSSGRGKKSKDDEAYRPKGGSSRPAKRKRENSESGKVVKKKSRTSIVAQEDADMS